MSASVVRRVALLGLVLAGLVAAVLWAKRPHPVAVTVVEIAQGRVESSVANTRAGSVEACQRTKLSTTLGGRIEVLAVKEGDHVKKGQLLMKLWNDDQQAQSTLAQAQVRAPGVLVQVASLAQPPLLVTHSLMSLQVTPSPV